MSQNPYHFRSVRTVCVLFASLLTVTPVRAAPAMPLPGCQAPAPGLASCTYRVVAFEGKA